VRLGHATGTFGLLKYSEPGHQPESDLQVRRRPLFGLNRKAQSDSS
jgi:hypothetical protein